MFSFVKTAASLAINILGKPFNFTKSHPDFEEISAAIVAKEWDKVQALADRPRAIEASVDGLVQVVHGQLFYDNMPIHGIVVDRIKEMKAAGQDITAMTNFLHKAKQNPAKFAIDELWLFMQSGRMPLCSDGDFLAFKMVDADYKDCHTHRIDNRIGQQPAMPREAVDPVRAHHCSTGFHFCARGYVNSGPLNYSHVMVVKINPADVVSIPSDYNNTKGRCWTYEVVGEVGVNIADEEMDGLVKDVWKTAYQDVSDDELIEDEPDDEFDEVEEDEFEELEEDEAWPHHTNGDPWAECEGCNKPYEENQDLCPECTAAGDDEFEDLDIEIIPGAEAPDSGTVVAQVVTKELEPEPEPRWWLIAYTDANRVLRETRAFYPTKVDVILAIGQGKIRFRKGFTGWCDIQPTDPLPPRPDHASGKGMTLQQRKDAAAAKKKAKKSKK